jgi:hypothetical protein
MGTIEEWEQKIEARVQNIKMAFFEYAWDNELPVFNTSYYLARQVLQDECILLKYCIIRGLIESDIMQIVEEKWAVME